MRKVCVFLPNWVGDLVMATPTLRALRHHFGEEARITGIMKPYLTDILAGTSWLDEIWFYDRMGTDQAIRPRALARRLRAARFDLSVHLTNDFLSAFLARWGRAAERVGYARYHRGALLTRRLCPPRDGRRYVPFSTLDYYLRIAAAVGCPPEPADMELATTAEEERRADEAWRNLGIAPGTEVVALNSSGAYGAAKLWPDESFTELARTIAVETGLEVLVICGPQERERAARIEKQAGHERVRSLAGQELSLGLTKACLKRCRLLVTTDSGPRHIAAAFGRRIISLLGPTHQAWSDTHYDGDTPLQLALDCGPCQQRECPLGHHRCMRDLPVGSVMAEVRKALGAR